jgi:hypothetical protein
MELLVTADSVGEVCGYVQKATELQKELRGRAA